MIKKLDKLKESISVNRKIVVFLIGLSLVGILLGSFYTVLLQDADKTLVKDYMTDFIGQVQTGKMDVVKGFLNNVLSTSLFVLPVWLLGISVIGVPIIIFMYFSKTFVMGFSIASFILNMKAKGALLSFLYIFPHGIITLGLYILLLNYAVTLSIKIVNSFVKKKSIDFKNIMYKYSIILAICFGGTLLMNAYESFLLPKILHFVLGILK